jgi:hypothetical protein
VSGNLFISVLVIFVKKCICIIEVSLFIKPNFNPSFFVKAYKFLIGFDCSQMFFDESKPFEGITEDSEGLLSI